MKVIKTKKNNVNQAKIGPKLALNGKLVLGMCLDFKISMNLICAAVMKHQQIKPAKAEIFINQVKTVVPSLETFKNAKAPKTAVPKTP